MPFVLGHRKVSNVPQVSGSQPLSILKNYGGPQEYLLYGVYLSLFTALEIVVFCCCLGENVGVSK